MSRSTSPRPVSAATALVAALALAPPLAHAQQQSCPQSLKPGQLDSAAIKQKAAELATLKSLLADPDGNVRLLALKQAVTSCDPTTRETAIEFGLASNETAMVTAALRGTLTGRDALILRYRKATKEAEPSAAENVSYILAIKSYDPNSGAIAGNDACRWNDNTGDWTGNVSSASITFVNKNGICSGRLVWDAEKAQFRGTAVLDLSNAEHAITWTPF